MNANKKESNRKQIGKLQQKKKIQHTALQNEYHRIVAHMLKQNVYLDKFSLLPTEMDDIRTHNQSNDPIYLKKEHPIYKKCMTIVSSFTEKDFDISNVNSIEHTIRQHNDTLKTLTHQKKDLITATNNYKQKYTNEPSQLITYIKKEESNMNNSLYRIKELEERNNNQCIDNVYQLYKTITDQQNKIREDKKNIEKQRQNLITYSNNNIKERKNTLSKLSQQKNTIKQQHANNKDNSNYKTQISQKIQEMGVDINRYKEIIMGMNRGGDYDTHLFKSKEEAYTYFQYHMDLSKKKMDYFIREEKKQKTIITNTLILHDKQLKKPKVMSKSNYQLEKEQLNTFISMLGNDTKKLDTLMAKQKQFLQDNIDYNDKLEMEFQSAKSRLIKVCTRMNDTYKNGRIQLQGEIDRYNSELSIIDDKKTNLYNEIIRLEKKKCDSNKDILVIRQHLKNSDAINGSLIAITRDISNYQKML